MKERQLVGGNTGGHLLDGILHAARYLIEDFSLLSVYLYCMFVTQLAA